MFSEWPANCKCCASCRGNVKMLFEWPVSQDVGKWPSQLPHKKSNPQRSTEVNDVLSIKLPVNDPNLPDFSGDVPRLHVFFFGTPDRRLFVFFFCTPDRHLFVFFCIRIGLFFFLSFLALLINVFMSFFATLDPKSPQQMVCPSSPF